jgi:putative Mg2+ transporter-C (MgtC) family protein
MELLGFEHVDFFVRLLVAMFLGALLGMERRVYARKMAGMRTYALVSMGAALFVVVADIVTVRYVGITMFDPLRVASQVVVGIGFIGAGLIIFHESRLVGLTTAAGLWVAAGIGVAAGYGLYAIAFFVTLLTLFIFVILWHVEQWLAKKGK